MSPQGNVCIDTLLTGSHDNMLLWSLYNNVYKRIFLAYRRL